MSDLDTRLNANLLTPEQRIRLATDLLSSVLHGGERLPWPLSQHVANALGPLGRAVELLDARDELMNPDLEEST